MVKMYRSPIATYNYFRVLNIDEERQKFLVSSDYVPKFEYPKYFNEEKILSRQQSIADSSVKCWLFECILSGVRLQNDRNELNHFREINAKLFGVPNKSCASSILSRMLALSTKKTDLYRDEIILALGRIVSSDVQLGPAPDVFLKYKSYFKDYRKHIGGRNRNISAVIERELINSGLAEKGWKLHLVDDNSHARTNHRNKIIKIGKEYNSRTMAGVERIAVHEVYGHALRGQQSSTVESEGFALMVEQLIGDDFKFRRSYRYLAASLGWGVFGKPMAFREVYEIIWRLMIIASKYDEQKAKKYAFGECCRVFRGGRPDIPGAVYLKDIVYFEANIRVWNILSTREIDYDEFVDIIEGRGTIIT